MGGGTPRKDEDPSLAAFLGDWLYDLVTSYLVVAGAMQKHVPLPSPQKPSCHVLLIHLRPTPQLPSTSRDYTFTPYSGYDPCPLISNTPKPLVLNMVPNPYVHIYIYIRTYVLSLCGIFIVRGWAVFNITGKRLMWNLSQPWMSLCADRWQATLTGFSQLPPGQRSRGAIR